MTGNQLLSSGKLPTPKKQTDRRRASGLKVYLFGQLGRGGFVHLFTTVQRLHIINDEFLSLFV
jgi:hypothetical protein